MNINYIDQLTQWWDEAEIPNANTLPRDGDRIIVRYNSEWYEIATADGYADESEIGSNTRILARTPKPKPAWHDAVAVIAEVHAFDLPRVFVKGDDGIWNDALTGRGYSPDALSHVTPLIEAKVTDEMVDRARDYMSINTGQTHTHNAIRGVITTALGLDPA